MTNIQKAFEESVETQQFSFNKADLTKDIYDPNTYKSDFTNVLFTYFLAGLNEGLRA